jgi:hypothetical protein
MNKILIEILVPTMENSFEVLIPANKKVYKVISLITKAINELSYGAFPTSKEFNLINASNGEVLDINKSIKAAGIVDGIKLILI